MKRTLENTGETTVKDFKTQTQAEFDRTGIPKIFEYSRHLFMKEIKFIYLIIS